MEMDNKTRTSLVDDVVIMKPSMNEEFLTKQLHITSYKLKEGTATSYYCVDGNSPLPKRLGMLTGNDMPSYNHSGKQIHRTATARLQGKFTKDETSPYKQNKPFNITTTLWQSEDYPQFVGWGTIGITGNDGKITARSDTGDLVVIYSPDSNTTLQVYIVDGMGKTPDTLAEGLKFISKQIQY